MIIKRSECHYFDDLSTFIIAVVSTTLMFEVYSTNRATPYRDNDGMGLQSKQRPKRLIIYPYHLLNAFFKQAKWPEEVRIEEEPVAIPPQSTNLNTGHLETALTLYASTLGNYYEKKVDIIKSKFSDDVQKWPSVWNFGRVVRNSFYHNNRIKIDNPNANVCWESLSYNYSDNGRVILNTDIWPADLIYLMMDMDKHL